VVRQRAGFDGGSGSAHRQPEFADASGCRRIGCRFFGSDARGLRREPAMNLRTAPPLFDLHRRRPCAAANKLLCAGFVAICSMPGHGEAAEALADAKPNVVLASVLAATPAYDTVTDARRDATTVERDALSTFTAMRWSSSAELSGGQYRWSASRGGLDVGMSFAMSAQDGRRVDLLSDNAGPLVPTLPHSASVAAREPSRRRHTFAPTGPRINRRAAYASKIGLEWKPQQSRVHFLREGLGQSASMRQDRMTVGMRKGVLGIYM
jgi:hypothetical protein